MVKKTAIYASILLATIFTACSTSDEIILATYSVGNVTKSEFAEKYSENNGGIDKAKTDSISSYREYLNLYTDYKLKLRNAHIRGYDKLPEIQNEYNNYVELIGESYIIEKQILEPRLAEIYDKMEEEVRISHILIRTDDKPEEAAKNKAEMLIERIQKGEDFVKICKENNEHKQTRDNGGDLYYFTVNQILRPIEKAMDVTKIGEIYPKPVKTAYGYHIIKVTDRQPRKYKVKASHILVKFVADSTGKIDTLATKSKIDSIAQKIKLGENFEELAQKYSDDKPSAAKGGDLNYFERRRMVIAFDSAAFSMNVNEISEPILTNFGYHIIKVTDIEDLPPYKTLEMSIRETYKKTAFDSDKQDYVATLEPKFKVKKNEKLLDLVATKLKSVKYGDNFSLNEKYNELKDSVILSVEQTNVTIAQLLNGMAQNKDSKNREINKADLEKETEAIKTHFIFVEQAKRMQNENPEFSNLMKEFKNGLLIYKMQEDEIWSKIEPDTNAYKIIYEEKRNELNTDNYVTYDRIYSDNDSLLSASYKEISDGKLFDEVLLSIENNPKGKLRIEKDVRKTFDEGAISKEASLMKENTISTPMKRDRFWSIIRLKSKELSRPKTYEESLPEVQTIYQERKTKELSAILSNKMRKIYNVEFNYEALNELYK